jgi:hypothetical protein
MRGSGMEDVEQVFGPSVEISWTDPKTGAPLSVCFEVVFIPPFKAEIWLVEMHPDFEEQDTFEVLGSTAGDALNRCVKAFFMVIDARYLRKPLHFTMPEI